MKQADLSKQLTKLVEARIKKDGVRMSKQISSGGFFSLPTYDYRMVYSFKDLNELVKEGFTVDSDIAIILFNSFIEG